MDKETKAIFNVLIITDLAVWYGENVWYDNNHCPNGRETSRMMTDGVVEWGDSTETAKEQGFFGGGKDTPWKVKEFTWIVIINEGRYPNGSGYRKLGLLIRRRGTDPGPGLADALLAADEPLVRFW